MKTAVLGMGAIGGLFAGYLKEKNADVLGVARPCQIDFFQKQGLIINGVRGQSIIKKLEMSPRLTYPVDLAVFAVKTQDLETVVKDNLDFLKDAYILSTQNGIRAEYILERYFKREKIISGIVLFGASFAGQNKISHNFEGDLILGSVFEEKIEGIENIVCFLGQIFKVSRADNIKGRKYLKLFINLNNSIAACLGEPLQSVFSDIEICKVAISLIKEAYQVMNGAGIILEDLPTYPKARVEGFSIMPLAAAAALFSRIMITLSAEPLDGSILQSIKRGRLTEIDYINGEVVALARQTIQPAPLNEKIVELVHRVEKNKQFFSKEEFLKELL